jgi:hypothetical protein
LKRLVEAEVRLGEVEREHRALEIWTVREEEASRERETQKDEHTQAQCKLLPP